MDLGTLCAWTGGVLLLGGVPMWQAWLPPNPIWGVRIPIAYSSRQNWDRLNRVAGAVMTGWGVAFIAAGIAMLTTGVTTTTGEAIALLGALAALALVGHLSWQVGREAAQMRSTEHQQRITLHDDPQRPDPQP